MAKRGNSKGQTEQAAERRVEALKLRQDGWSYRRIAEKLDVSVSTAHDDVHHALKELNELERTEAAELRRLELERLDIALAAVMPQVEQGRLLAVDRLLSIMDRRAKFLGLDAPTKQQTEVSGELEVVSNAAATLDAKLATILTRVGTPGTYEQPDDGGKGEPAL
jgi:hypothetical protein